MRLGKKIIGGHRDYNVCEAVENCGPASEWVWFALTIPSPFPLQSMRNRLFSSSASAASLTVGNINPCVLAAQYAVRGELVIRAQGHAEALARGEPRPFKKLIYCNIGNPQDLAQPPLTFFRQVLSLLNWEPLLSPANAQHVGALFPSDAIARARRYAASSRLGAYSHSQGIPLIREEVAQFIKERDGGVHANASDLYLTDGASPAARTLLSLVIRGPKDGVMVPVPQYPLYAATISLQNGAQVNYLLNEEKNWSLEVRAPPHTAPLFSLSLSSLSLFPPLTHPTNPHACANARPIPLDGGA